MGRAVYYPSLGWAMVSTRTRTIVAKRVPHRQWRGFIAESFRRSGFRRRTDWVKSGTRYECVYSNVPTSMPKGDEGNRAIKRRGR